jgi:ATP-dependent RNA helicase DbpA
MTSTPAPDRAEAAASFAHLPLPPATLQRLAQQGYTTMTPIQAASLPLTLAGHDLIAQARTGSGKTAAYALALLQRVQARQAVVQALVLCPTRELADQVTAEIRRLARTDEPIKVLTLSGGVALRPQQLSLAHGAHVVVGTPGRVLDHLARESLDLAALQTLVLDEADRMLDMGFFDDIAQVARRCPKPRQTLLFSATYPEGIAKLSAQFMHEPREVRLAEPPARTQIRQRFYEVAESERLHTVQRLLEHYRPERTLAFCNTKQQCRDLTAVLRAQGYVALELHGDLEQRERDQVLVRFANRSASVLVATDLAARGLDIAGLEAVVNVDITPDPSVHTHRIGRTGRVDAEGWALSLASLDEMGRVGAIESALGFTSEWHPLASLTPQPGLPALRPPMQTLQIVGGRKEKIRAGDVLGALTKDLGFAAAQVGKIDVNEFSTYVAVEAGIAVQALKRLSGGRIKGRSVKLRLVQDGDAGSAG